IARTISDSITNWDEYGLLNPELVLTLETFEKELETLKFGIRIDSEGVPRYFLRRGESSSVCEISSEVFYSLSSRPYQWREARVWNFTPVDLHTMLVEKVNQTPLKLSYRDLSQRWNAQRETENVSALLNEKRANRLLDHLEELKATRWLEEDHPGALTAMRDPVFQLTAVFKRPDDASAPIRQDTLKLARVRQKGSNKLYYGKVDSVPNFFLVDVAQVKKLAVDLLSD
ncbi:MAG: DUF4340 domain-containing protein, partial [Verrucomicrobiota bacterium]